MPKEQENLKAPGSASAQMHSVLTSKKWKVMEQDS